MSIPGVLLTMLGHPLLGAAFIANEFIERKYPTPDPIDAQLAYEEKRERLQLLFVRQFKRWAFDTDKSHLSNDEMMFLWNQNHEDIVVIASPEEVKEHLPTMMRYWYEHVYEGPK